MCKPIAFFDRDGVLNTDKGYVYKPKDFEWINGSIKTIKYLNDKDYLVIVVTNQAGIGRGYYEESDVNKLHKFMNLELLKHNALINYFFYSPYHPDGINQNYKSLAYLRKPETGMLELASKKWGIDKSKSFMVGDMPHDIKCARKFGIESFLFNEKNLFDFLIPKLKTVA